MLQKVVHTTTQAWSLVTAIPTMVVSITLNTHRNKLAVSAFEVLQVIIALWKVVYYFL
jgi:hypothetical protein